MDWQTVVVLAALTCLVSIAMLRVELKQRRRVLLVLPLPALFLLWRWSLYRDVWLEPLLGVGLGLMAAAVWWVRRGRRLPAPTSDNIRVWTKDQPFDD
ncbi:MAG: hypothetical protein MUO23_01700 [Anaerolineales bacterium]|nr:hypothetical protein [Anaerolineales bacterium]